LAINKPENSDTKILSMSGSGTCTCSGKRNGFGQTTGLVPQ
jgi:hypothetical protein